MTTPIRTLLRLESLAAFVAAIALYRHAGGTWPMFAALFLVPDLSMLAYLANPRAGALAYNAAHSYVGPALLALAGQLPLAALWAAHVGFDRALGYGLKHATAFTDTHLGRVGRAVTAAHG